MRHIHIHETNFGQKKVELPQSSSNRYFSYCGFTFTVDGTTVDFGTKRHLLTGGKKNVKPGYHSVAE